MRPSSNSDAFDHCGDGRLVGDVGGDGDRPRAAPSDIGDCRARLCRVASDDGDIGARVGKPARHAEPDAAVAAGDDRDPATEIE